MSRSSSSCCTARYSSGRWYFSNSVAVTRLTFTSVVWAESMTDTSSSSGLRNVRAMAASWCSSASRSTIGRMRARFGPTRLRASATKLRRTDELWGRLAQPHSRAHEVERRAPGARELARRRSELAGLNPRDRHGELGFQLAQLVARERRRHHGVRTLEELVHDLDLVGAGAEARERVDEPLQPVPLLDDRFGRHVTDEVRLVVDDERPAAFEVQHVEEAVQKHAVVLERERPLLRHAGERRDATRDVRLAVSPDECADARDLLLARVLE